MSEVRANAKPEDRKAQLDELRSRLNRLYGEAPRRSQLRDRLEKLSRPRGTPASLGRYLGGEWKERPGGPLLTVDRSFPQDHCHGGIPLNQIHRLSSRSLRLLSGTGFSRFEPCRTLFFDTETTGLAGGAGTCIFLAGVGWFEDGVFRIRQFFLPGYQAETAFLRELDEFIHNGHRFQHLVSFNGKCYDLNLLENRFVMARLKRPFVDFDHLDLLHPSRLLWRGRFEDCGLQTLERHLLGLRRDGDIPSALIPRIYFNFVRSGRYQAFDRVFRHNRTDLLSLVSLMSLAGRLVEEPDERLYVDPLTASRVHQLRGNEGRAVEILEEALENTPRPSSDLLLQLGLLRKRAGRFGEALEMFLRLCRERRAPRIAFVEAAKILEHQKRDFEKALQLVDRALEFDQADERLLHRRYRLRCRLEGKRWY